MFHPQQKEMTSTDNTIDGYCPKGQSSDSKDASHHGRAAYVSCE
jgi:urocanate hydratase